MTIEALRDLIIIVSGATTIVALFLISVLFIILYRRIDRVLNSVETISRKAREISTYVSDEVVKPSVQVVAMLQGVRNITNLLRRKQGGKDGGNR